MPGRTSPAVLQVFIFRGGEFLGTDMFSERSIVVGRDPTVADLVLESSQVSRRHAIIEHDGEAIKVRDTGSTNGILVNDRKVESSKITRLDEILLGDFSLKLKLMGGTKADAAAGGAPTRVLPSVSEAQPEAKRQARKRADSGRVTKADRTPAPVSKARAHVQAAPAADLSDWDDVSGEHDVPGAKDGGRSGRRKSRGKKRRPAKAAVQSAAQDAEDSRPLAAARDADAFPENEELPAGPILPPPEDDEEDEDANYVPPYSLVAQLLQEDARVVASARGRSRAAVEVLTLAGDSVIDSHLLMPGQSFWIGPRVGLLRRMKARDLSPRVRLLKYKRNGECRVEMHKQVTATLQKGAQRAKLGAGSEGTEQDRRRGTFKMSIRSGEVLDVSDTGRTYHIRFVSPPARLADPRTWRDRLRPDAWTMRAFGGSTVTHLVVLIAMSLMMPAQAIEGPSQTDEFVEVTIEAEPQLEEPPPEEKPPEPEPETKQAAVEKVPPKMEAAPSKRKRPRHGGTSKAPPGVLGLLSKRGSSAAPGPAAAVAAVSNLSAAKVPGARSGYRVSGLIGKLPTSSLSVGGGGGGLMTKGGAALLRGGGGGAGRLSGKGTRRVGGLVQKNPKALKPKGQGHLDRDEIQKVINQNIGQIQRCYERELLKSPGLSGKIQVEWTIATSGGVRMARQTYTSMKSTAVSNCIMGAIKSWRFPRPRGGEVIVNYPFIFKSIGF